MAYSTAKKPIRSAMLATNVWGEMKNDKLSAIAKQLFIFILTNERKTSFGCYKLPIAIMESNITGNIRAALHELIAEAYIRYDFKEEIIAIPSWFRHNKPAFAKNLSEASSILTMVPIDSVVYPVLLELLQKTPVGKAHNLFRMKLDYQDTEERRDRQYR